MDQTYNGFKLGDRVTVKGAGDGATIYEIVYLIDRFLVRLDYRTETGVLVSGGVMDSSLLQAA